MKQLTKIVLAFFIVLSSVIYSQGQARQPQFKSGKPGYHYTGPVVNNNYRRAPVTRRYHAGPQYRKQYYRHDNGRHRGWYKHRKHWHKHR